MNGSKRMIKFSDKRHVMHMNGIDRGASNVGRIHHLSNVLIVGFKNG